MAVNGRLDVIFTELSMLGWAAGNAGPAGNHWNRRKLMEPLDLPSDAYPHTELPIHSRQPWSPQSLAQTPSTIRAESMNSSSGTWSPAEVAYLLFYTAHGLTHQSIATLLDRYAKMPSGKKARTLDAVRSKAKELRSTLGLNDGQGRCDPEKVLEFLSRYLTQHGLVSPDPDRELTEEEAELRVGVIFYSIVTMY
ncbi:unnamed protein product [Tuber aestivum]|uniref:Uncharacterized protein n=1 Tax=Tuber aestivum TaxID=59557 RepID=A0A292PL08_9PEZI|nr:unnamed protein product [Tuber aestivum]